MFEAGADDEPQPALSLEAVIAARTPVHWVEAVAIIERACAALIGKDGVETPAPDSSGIAIESNGSIVVVAGDGAVLSANRLGRTLHSLASAGPMPVPLRLLVTKWIETAENHSIAEVREELAHFVKPDGETPIRAVYERWEASQPRRPRTPTAVAALTVDTAVTAAAEPDVDATTTATAAPSPGIDTPAIPTTLPAARPPGPSPSPSIISRARDLATSLVSKTATWARTQHKPEVFLPPETLAPKAPPIAQAQRDAQPAVRSELKRAVFLAPETFVPKFEPQLGALREAELVAQREAALAAQREAALAAQREAELVAQREAALAAQREAELVARAEPQPVAPRSALREPDPLSVFPFEPASEVFLEPVPLESEREVIFEPIRSELEPVPSARVESSRSIPKPGPSAWQPPPIAPMLAASVRALVPRLRSAVHGLKVQERMRRLPAPNVSRGAALAAGVLVVLGGTVWLMSSADSTSQASTAATNAATPPSQSIELPEAPGSPTQARAGVRPSATRPDARPTAAATVAQPFAVVPGRRPSQSQAPSVNAPSRAASATATSSLSVLAAMPPEAASAPTRLSARRAETRVYTDADQDVQPPIMMSPQVRPGTSAGPESDFNTMEIVVSESGRVEQVRLLSTPKRMTDMMLLSGAKNWRFEPASIDGSAVRYRMAITWPTTR